MMWSNDKLPMLANSLITEYDISMGNVSIMEAFELVPKEMIDYLKGLSKYERVVKVGLLQKEDKEFAKKLEDGFTQAVQKFIQSNHLDIDTDVTDIRRDAVYVVSRPIRYTSFSKGAIKFRPKSSYHAMLKLSQGLMVFYRNRSEIKEGMHHIEVDGLIREDAKAFNEVMRRLTPGPLAFLEEFMEVTEGCNQRKSEMYRWLIDFADLYKSKKLDPEYYREFTKKATFRIITEEGTHEVTNFEEEMFDDLDISYNYTHMIVPLLQIIV